MISSLYDLEKDIWIREVGLLNVPKVLLPISHTIFFFCFILFAPAHVFKRDNRSVLGGNRFFFIHPEISSKTLHVLGRPRSFYLAVGVGRKYSCQILDGFTRRKVYPNIDRGEFFALANGYWRYQSEWPAGNRLQKAINTVRVYKEIYKGLVYISVVSDFLPSHTRNLFFGHTGILSMNTLSRWLKNQGTKTTHVVHGFAKAGEFFCESDMKIYKSNLCRTSDFLYGGRSFFLNRYTLLPLEPSDLRGRLLCVFTNFLGSNSFVVPMRGLKIEIGLIESLLSVGANIKIKLHPAATPTREYKIMRERSGVVGEIDRHMLFKCDYILTSKSTLMPQMLEKYGNKVILIEHIEDKAGEIRFRFSTVANASK